MFCASNLLNHGWLSMSYSRCRFDVRTRCCGISLAKEEHRLMTTRAKNNALHDPNRAFSILRRSSFYQLIFHSQELFQYIREKHLERPAARAARCEPATGGGRNRKFVYFSSNALERHPSSVHHISLPILTYLNQKCTIIRKRGNYQI